MVRYISVRDTSHTPHTYTFQEALYSGYSSHDGAMLLPSFIPSITVLMLKEWEHCTYKDHTDMTGMTTDIWTYKEVVYHILRMYLDDRDINDTDLQYVVDKSYN